MTSEKKNAPVERQLNEGDHSNFQNASGTTNDIRVPERPTVGLLASIVADGLADTFADAGALVHQLQAMTHDAPVTFAQEVAASVRVRLAATGKGVGHLALFLNVSRAAAAALWAGLRPYALDDLEVLAVELHVPVSALVALPDDDPDDSPGQTAQSNTNGRKAALDAAEHGGLLRLATALCAIDTAAEALTDADALGWTTTADGRQLDQLSNNTLAKIGHRLNSEWTARTRALMAPDVAAGLAPRHETENADDLLRLATALAALDEAADAVCSESLLAEVTADEDAQLDNALSEIAALRRRIGDLWTSEVAAVERCAR